MKKITSLLTIALLSLMAFSLTSCDEDHEIAFDLEGTWRGQVQTNRDRIYVDFHFRQDGFSKHGTGTEYDNDYFYSDFDWSVNNGCIYINYPDGERVVIADYTLSSGQLSGYLQNARSGWDLGYIRLTRQSRNTYDSYHYYSKEQKELTNDSIAEGTKETEE